MAKKQTSPNYPGMQLTTASRVISFPALPGQVDGQRQACALGEGLHQGHDHFTAQALV